MDKKSDDVPFTKPLTPVNGPLKLEEGSEDTVDDSQMVPLSIDEQYRHERKAAKLKHWRESPFAVGLVEPNWRDELGPSVCGGFPARDDDDADGAGCLCCSAFVCDRLGAGRVGNMAVLRQTTEWVEEVEVDEETGEEKTQRFTRPRLICLAGPYWPMLLFVTYPLIFGVSLWTLRSAIPGKPLLLQLVWLVCTCGLILALGLTSFRDPGILYRQNHPPPQEESAWRWNDTALTFRPRGAFYDPDCAVVVEEFDHTCPWTGTAIGRKNMPAFQSFVGLVFLCLIIDIMLLTGFFGRSL